MCLTFNLAWDWVMAYGQQAPSAHTVFRILVAIPETVQLAQVFDLAPHDPGKDYADTLYHFRGMIVFTGAHYLSVFRGQFGWTIFDDAKLTPLATWIEVIHWMLETNSFPRTLFFEKNTKFNYPTVRISSE